MKKGAKTQKLRIKNEKLSNNHFYKNRRSAHLLALEEKKNEIKKKALRMHEEVEKSFCTPFKNKF